ncbi:MAG: SapC family protein [Paraglaciecola sp.]|uniref:SapC family protein n=1 Tax=Paraglaciecola sp. TaxID=1920173 RepID=UPI003299E12B
MEQIQLLDFQQHANLKISQDFGVQHGDNVSSIPVLVNELEKLVLDYPIFFIKDNETGQFGLHVLTGFYPEQNLYINNGLWNSIYLPLNISRQPFLLGKNDDNTANQTVPILINRQSSRINTHSGHAIFESDGRLSHYMEQVKIDLNRIFRGAPATQSFIQFVSQHGLIESVNLDIQFANGKSECFQGLYTANCHKINQLKETHILDGARNGYLAYMTLISASIGNVKKLLSVA